MGLQIYALELLRSTCVTLRLCIHHRSSISKDSAVTVTFRVEVIEMQQELFHNHEIQLRNIYTERTKDVDRKSLEFSKVVNGVTQKREHSQEVWVRYTYDVSEMPRRASFHKKSHVNYCILHLPPTIFIKKITDSKVSTYHSKQNRVIHQSLSVSSSTAGRSMYTCLLQYWAKILLPAFGALIGRGYLT